MLILCEPQTNSLRYFVARFCSASQFSVVPGCCQRVPSSKTTHLKMTCSTTVEFPGGGVFCTVTTRDGVSRDLTRRAFTLFRPTFSKLTKLWRPSSSLLLLSVIM